MCTCACQRLRHMIAIGRRLGHGADFALQMGHHFGYQACSSTLIAHDVMHLQQRIPLLAVRIGGHLHSHQGRLPQIQSLPLERSSAP